MTNVKVKAALPKDEETNGLGDVARKEFLADLKKPRVAIVVLQPEEVTKSLANGVEVPKLAITRIELIEDAEEAEELVQRAMVLSERRTGNTPLPTIGGQVEDDGLGFEETTNEEEN